MVSYIGLSQKWSAARVEATGNHIILERKLFSSFGKNFICDSCDILFLDPDIQRWVEYPMTLFLKVTFYWENTHDWYLTIIHRR